MLHPQAAHDLRLSVYILIGIAKNDAVAVLCAHGLCPVEHFREERVGDVRHHKADGPSLPHAQTLRYLVRYIALLLDDVEDTFCSSW
ncbi:MAG: hypothetical protein BWY85_01730 [Firmicutes bacterium ADurb.Bin506]|nr:MAG: hypothetical protein BWY85_01730 [Firmicutes bacterium ADurb.Bin506]